MIPYSLYMFRVLSHLTYDALCLTTCVLRRSSDVLIKSHTTHRDTDSLRCVQRTTAMRQDWQTPQARLTNASCGARVRGVAQSLPLNSATKSAPTEVPPPGSVACTPRGHACASTVNHQALWTNGFVGNLDLETAPSGASCAS